MFFVLVHGGLTLKPSKVMNRLSKHTSWRWQDSWASSKLCPTFLKTTTFGPRQRRSIRQNLCCCSDPMPTQQLECESFVPFISFLGKICLAPSCYLLILKALWRFGRKAPSYCDDKPSMFPCCFMYSSSCQVSVAPMTLTLNYPLHYQVV